MLSHLHMSRTVWVWQITKWLALVFPQQHKHLMTERETKVWMAWVKNIFWGASKDRVCIQYTVFRRCLERTVKSPVVILFICQKKKKEVKKQTVPQRFFNFAITEMNAELSIQSKTLQYSKEFAIFQFYIRFSTDLGQDVSCGVITTRIYGRTEVLYRLNSTLPWLGLGVDMTKRSCWLEIGENLSDIRSCNK